MSQTVHSDTSAQSLSAIQYQASQSLSHILPHTHVVAAQNVFCRGSANHCITHLVQVLILSVALTQAVSTFQANHNLAANHLLS